MKGDTPMLIFINEELFKTVKKPHIEGFRKTQIRTIGSDDYDLRVCTFLYDGEDINSHRLNIKCNATDNEPNVVIRSNERNTFDATIAVMAIPFNGVLLKSKVENFRFRKAIIVPVTDDIANSYPEAAGYEYIFYCIVEPNVNTLIMENHARFTDKIRVSIITKVLGEESGVNHILDFYKDGENLVSKYTEKTWNTERCRETQPMEIPFKVYLPMRHDGGDGNTNKLQRNNAKNNRNINGGYHKNSGNVSTSGGYSNGYNNTNDRKSTNKNRNNDKYEKPVRRDRDHSYDEGFDIDGGGRYPAKKQKTMNNRNKRDNGYRK